MTSKIAAKKQLQRSISSTDKTTSAAIFNSVEHDLTVPADRSKHRFFFTMSKHDLILPSVSRFDPDFRKFFFATLVDFDLQRGLEDAKCLNWCESLPKFLPLVTLADGNCLMNAASLAMWAVNDDQRILRKSVYQVLVEDQTDAFRCRWELETKENLEDHHGSSVSCSNGQWDQDRKNIMELASMKISSETNCFYGLEEIHVFALANVLRRPIIVLCDDVFCGNQDESLANVNMGGVYLPLLCDSVDCVKSPLVLGYQYGHFTALVTTEDGGENIANNDEMGRNKNAVPLVKYDGAPMKLHFLSPEEKQNSDRLIREYLICLKVDCCINEVSTSILTAVIKFQEPEPHLNQLFKTFFDELQALYVEVLQQKIPKYQLSAPQPVMTPPFLVSATSAQFPVSESPVSEPCCRNHKICASAGCINYTTHGLCFQCKKEKKNEKCISPECEYNGKPEQEGMCSTCFARYHAVLQGGNSGVPRPSAPPSENICHTVGCDRQANPKLYGWCDICYISAIQSMNAGQQKMQFQAAGENRVSSPVTPPRYFRQVSIFCHNESCRNELEEPGSLYCNECKDTMSGSSYLAGTKTCNFSGCTNVLSSASPKNLCGDCISKLQTPNLSKGTGQSSYSSAFKVCQVPGCTMPAITYHGQLCLAHYQQSQCIHRSREIQKNRYQDDVEERKQCINIGCPFYGSSESNYLCSHCHARALQELYDLQQIKEEQERTKMEWLTRNTHLPDQYMYQQSSQYNRSDLRKPFYFEGSTSSYNACPGRSSSPPASPTLRAKWSTATTPCKTQGCPHFCVDQNEQLCDKCLEREQFGRSVGPTQQSRICSDP